MDTIIRFGAEESTRTVVLDGLSWRDIALGAVLMLLLVLVLIAVIAARERRRGLRPEEGGDPSHPVHRDR